MARHRKDYKSFKRGQKGHTRSFDIFNEYGIDTCKIEWIEDYPCNTKKELDEADALQQFQLRLRDLYEGRRA